MQASSNRKSLNRPFIQLSVITFIVVSTIIIVNIASWQTTQSVSQQTSQLIHNTVPQLKVLNNLESIANKRILNLYIYYSTLDARHWENFTALQDEFNKQRSSLVQGNSIFNYHEALETFNEELNKSAKLFHDEMQNKSSRDWDKVRTFLALAQSNTDQLIHALDIASDVTRVETVDSTQMTLAEVLQLKNIQMWFSIAIGFAACMLIFMLHGKLVDQKKLHKQTYFDNLTGLPNRKQLEAEWKNNNTTKKFNKLFLIKLDQYHLIASTYGHNFADEAALQVTERLATLRNSYRDIGLYQFSRSAWLINITNHSQNISETSLAEKAISIIANQPLILDDRELSVTCSIGITDFPDSGTSIDEPLKNANSALYESQKSGRNTYTVFHPRIKEKINKLIAIECNLREALYKDEFELYYQPKIDTSNQTSCSAEALIRWHHNGQIVSPSDFIPIAERSNLIIDIGNWVIDEACHQMSKWEKIGLAAKTISVNISPKHFLAPDFVNTVKYALIRHEIPAHCLELEITEEATMQNSNIIINKLKELKSLGVTISIDDFGTGYSSLSYIRELPIDTIKIDKSFIDAMTKSNNDLVIVQMIIQLAKKLNLKVVAEGVETEQQQHILSKYECDYLQGYLFSKPLSTDKYKQYLIQSDSISHTMHAKSSLQ